MQIKSCGSVTSAHFRNSFIRELIRQFLHNNGIQKYLQLALSSDLSIIMNDEVLTSMQESSLEYIEILLKYAVKLTNELIYCIPKIPSIIRYFFSEAFKVALRNFPEQTSEAYQLMEYFFINIILQPAMLNPKLFCLVTETAAITRSNHFTTLTKLFRWKLNHKLIPEMYIEKGILCNDTFKQLRVFEILEKIGIYDGGVEGISAKKLQKVTKVMSHPLLLSVNDILYLTQLVNDTINLIEVDSSEKAARYKFKELCNIGNVTLENDELLDFWFQSFKLPTNNMTNINDDEEEGAKIVLPIINKISNNNNGEESKEIEQLIVHLINYLQGIHPDPNAPTNLTKFLQKQMEKAEDISSNEWITRTQAIQSKIKRSHKSDDEILKILHNTINKRIFEHSSKFSISFKLQERGQELEMLYQNAKNANLQLKPIVYQAVLKLFLLRNDLVEKDIGSNILALMVKDQDWLSFFSSTADSLFKFAEQIGLDSSSNMALARQLHSGLVSKLPMKNFMIVNRELMQKNNQVVDLTDKAMALFMKETHSQNLTKLFENPNCFEPVYRILRNGTITGAPLERLAYICDAMTALQNIYLFETGEACAGDDFLPLVIYTLLGAKLPNLATLVKYISHYLFAITEKLRVLESKEKYVATTFVSAADHIFALIENLQKKDK
ncbi:hypothetical protein GPJ56_008103 [Histomonas meleagridis]|uniref:uncharacterized protein n=1 Tax=Histomonas meleagridis TaxID=135588 RepID=UPI0035596D97|nr:hypothetical protein GPJ56_008103 [Histomonas meleagridis]KAH0798946.1 hypothetical protein GO595_008236 [Histomonas meleagridis]